MMRVNKQWLMDDSPKRFFTQSTVRRLEIFESFRGNIAAWGLIAYYSVKTMSSMFGLDEAQTDAVSKAAGWGVATGRLGYAVAERGWLNWMQSGAGNYLGIGLPIPDSLLVIINL